jgi:hypothetical protein
MFFFGHGFPLQQHTGKNPVAKGLDAGGTEKVPDTAMLFSNKA